MKEREQITVVNMSHPLNEDAKDDIREYFAEFTVEFVDMHVQIDYSKSLRRQYLSIFNIASWHKTYAVILPELSWLAAKLAARWAEGYGLTHVPDIIVLVAQGTPPIWRLKEVL